MLLRFLASDCAPCNTDKVSNDTTKPCAKVLADGEHSSCTFQVTYEGDGRMNQHVTVCITTREDALFKDSENQIKEGACGLCVVHTDRSKSKESEMEERERQRQGKAPTENQVHPKFKEGLDNNDFTVVSTHSGSMTQEACSFSLVNQMVNKH